MVNIEDFHSNLLKNDKKSHRDIDINYIGYITIKKLSEYDNVHSVDQLCLIIQSAAGHFKEKNGEKYFIIKYEEVFSGIKSEIETINCGKQLFYGKIYARIGINTDDDLPLNKPSKFPTLTVIIKCVLQKDAKLYSQIYLDNCLYKL